MRDTIILSVMVVIVFIPACVDSSLKNLDNDSRKPLLADYNSTEILRRLTMTPCGSIKIYPGVKFYNLTGKMTAPITEGAILYMTSIRDLTFNNSLYAAENCAPVWRVRINEGQYFMIPDVPPGRYVAWVPSEKYEFYQGFPILDEFKDENHVLDISFYGGDSKYSMILFEIRPRN